MNYQWYPGHMTKARRMMQENIKLIDLVIELVDARIPISSRNPDIDELGKGKSRIILLNKSDLADPVWNKKWVEYFAAKGIGVLEINSRTGMGIKSIQGLVQEVCKEKIERDRKRGIVNRPVRAKELIKVDFPTLGIPTTIARTGRFTIPRFLSRSIFSLQTSCTSP
jgi:ribosome biogenesis GTPase A